MDLSVLRSSGPPATAKLPGGSVPYKWIDPYLSQNDITHIEIEQIEIPTHVVRPDDPKSAEFHHKLHATTTYAVRFSL
ncbi:hypothetical protein NXS19_012198 [Fusarium pseudograminearum]|nr:hypothetical protein NXS19_012198 [Fusarium pseudograminearum]